MSQFQTILKKYLDTFSDQELYFINDIRNIELFSKIPGNSKKDDVQTKVGCFE